MFPKPMPILHDAKLFPRLFSANKTFDVSYLPLDEEIAKIGENRNMTLSGSLCFAFGDNMLPDGSCVSLHFQNASWHYFDLNNVEKPVESCADGLTTWFAGWWPKETTNKTIQRRGIGQPKMAPHYYSPDWGHL